ncbi:hypothetical protein DL240_10620 [Lujinxingia litoralis]|uniref:Uncharacterized protein n=1 Tax=Lujinxingia litoralis TaxID=2211119 RepID=A0A328CAS1_9DELT|nr:tetratricopeptide repeat protein [Lujinxingia litoralis]RAL22297.1 hypothetical protein DL240_10620 [Lujinxingia litoralis]
MSQSDQAGGPSKEQEEAIDAIDTLIAGGELEQAEQAIEDALERFGANDTLLVLRAELALEGSDPEECVFAVQDALKHVESDEARAQLLAFEGYAHYEADAYEEGRRAFNDAVRADGELWTAVVGRAMVHEAQGFLRAALLDVERAIALDPEEAQPYSIRGNILLAVGNGAQAEADFKKAVELEPEDEESRLTLARLLSLAKKPSEAIEVLEHLVEQGEDPDVVAPGALLRSQLSLTLGSTAAASEDAQRAIELWPEEPWGYLQLAACHLTAAQADEAIVALKKAEELAGDIRDVPDIYALRASAYDMLEKPEKAKALREEAEGSPRLPGIVYGEALNPVRNIPLNPNKPIDVRGLLTELFGHPSKAPAGYEKAIRDVVDRLPEIIAQNPGVGRIQIELPQVEGMSGPPRSLIVQVAQPRGGQPGQAPRAEA